MKCLTGLKTLKTQTRDFNSKDKSFSLKCFSNSCSDDICSQTAALLLQGNTEPEEEFSGKKELNRNALTCSNKQLVKKSLLIAFVELIGRIVYVLKENISSL